jgi:hypothetical protein
VGRAGAISFSAGEGKSSAIGNAVAPSSSCSRNFPQDCRVRATGQEVTRRSLGATRSKSVTGKPGLRPSASAADPARAASSPVVQQAGAPRLKRKDCT